MIHLLYNTYKIVVNFISNINLCAGKITYHDIENNFGELITS